MSLTEIWATDPIDVVAVRVTEANMYDVAHWCNGFVGLSLETNKKYVSLGVTGDYDKGRQAVIGEWIVMYEEGFKIYGDQMFKLIHHKKPEEEKTK